MIKNIAKKAGGISLGSAMLLLSLMPATSAFAASVPAVVSVKLSSEQGTVAVGNTVSFTATATQSGSATPMYQFWYEGVHGNWHGTSWSSHNTFSLPALQQGSYEVVVFAKDKGQATSVNSEGTNTNQFVNVDSSATLTAPSLTNVAPGTTLNFTASSKNLTNPVYQLWIQKPDGTWYASGAYQSSPNFSITASTAGDYHAVLYAKDLNAPQTAQFSEYSKATFDAFGQAAAVKLSAASSSLVADGKATDTITATVVDSNGNTVQDFNGTVNLSIPTAGGTLTNSSVTITNGVGTDTLTAPSTAPSGAQTVSVAGLATTNGSAMATNVTYESTSITETTPTATQLAVSIASGSPSSIGTNTTNEYTDVTVALEDAAGNTWSNEPGQYVTLTLTGPGSFSSTSTQTTLTTFVTGTSAAIPVYSQVGTPGTVTITASGSAVSSGTLNIPTYNNTAPASLNVQTLNGKDSNGNAYTQYTVSLLDTNGHPYTNGNETLSVTNNAAAQSGAITYGTVNSAGVFTPGTAPTQLTDGVATFAVETATVGTSPVTLTLDDTTNSLTATTNYDFTPGAPTTVTVTPSATVGSATPTYKSEGGQTVTYSAQLVDVNNNTVNEAGQTVQFELVNNTANATLPTGTGVGTYSATTNSSGVATVSINVPSSQTSGTFEVAALYNNHTVDGASDTVVPAYNYATQLSVSGAPTSDVTAGSSLSAITATVENSLTGAVAGDTLQISTSNSAVLAVPTPDTTGGSVQTLTTTSSSSGQVTLPTLVAGTAGSATITVKDISDPAMPSTSFTVNVIPGVVYGNADVFYNGKIVNSTNEVTVAANSPIAIQVTNVDKEGDPVPVAGGNQIVALSDASNSGAFTATLGGGPITYATIPTGQTSVTVYYVNSTAGTYNLSGDTTDVGQSLAVTTPTVTAGTSAAYTLTLSGHGASTFSGTLPLSVTGAVNSPNGTAPTLPTSATFTDGTATVDATLTSTASQTLSFATDGLTASTTESPAAAAVATFTVATPSTQTVGTSYTTTVKAEDAYGNLTDNTGTITVSGTALAASPNGATATDSLGTFTNGAATLTVTSVDATSSAVLTVTNNASTPVTASSSAYTVDASAPAFGEIINSKTTGGTYLDAGTAGSDPAVYNGGPWGTVTTPTAQTFTDPTTQALSTAYTVAVQLVDVYGNAVTSGGPSSVTVTLTPGTSSTSTLTPASPATVDLTNGYGTFTYTTGGTAGTTDDALAVAGTGLTSFTLNVAD